MSTVRHDLPATDGPAGVLKWKCRDRVLEMGRRPLIMGILNATPDSFSDGGSYTDIDSAVARAVEMLGEGADIVDVGGESTRPGADAVGVDEEIRRVVPIVERLAARTDAVISVDTMKAVVAERALNAGARIINDVSALTYDRDMESLARDTGAGVVLMHMQGSPRTMQADPRYGDVVEEVRGYLCDRVDCLVSSGLDRQALAVDPGIGFGKKVEHNLDLLLGIDRICSIGVPVVVGLSRKSFLGKLTDRPVDERLAAGLAGLVYSVLEGAHVMRVHDVAASRDAARIVTALEERRVALD